MLQTQWRMIPMGGLQGLEYTAVKSVLDLLDVKNKADTFKDIRHIEIGVLQELKTNGK